MGDTIAVVNASFETLPAGGFTGFAPFGSYTYNQGIPGWTVGGAATGVFAPTSVAFTTLDNGPNSAFSNGPTISQTVSPVVALGVTYYDDC